MSEGAAGVVTRTGAAAYAERVYANAGNLPLLERLRPADRSVLDVGCGAGDNARHLKARGCTVHGVTLSRREFELAQPHVDRLTLADVETWEWDYPDGSFDAVLLSHVLEHLIDPPAALRRLARLLRPGGRAYIALPNVANWRLRLRFLAGRFEYDDHGLMDRTHLHFYTHFTAPRLVADAGLVLVESAADGHCPQPGLRRWLPGPAAAFDRLCCRLFPNLFADQLILVGEKPGGHDTR